MADQELKSKPSLRLKTVNLNSLLWNIEVLAKKFLYLETLVSLKLNNFTKIVVSNNITVTCKVLQRVLLAIFDLERKE